MWNLAFGQPVSANHLYRLEFLTHQILSSVCIIAIIRTSYLVQSNLSGPDITWDYSNATIWTLPECAVAIISACLSSLRPVVRLLTGRTAQSASKIRISKPASGNPYSCFPNEGPGQHTTRDNRDDRKNTLSGKNHLHNPLPDRKRNNGPTLSADTFNCMGHSYDIETGRRHKEVKSTNGTLIAKIIKRQQQAHLATRSLTWYNDSDDSISSADKDNIPPVFGRATRPMSAFYNL